MVIFCEYNFYSSFIQSSNICFWNKVFKTNIWNRNETKETNIVIFYENNLYLSFMQEVLN